MINRIRSVGLWLHIMGNFLSRVKKKPAVQCIKPQEMCLDRTVQIENL